MPKCHAPAAAAAAGLPELGADAQQALHQGTGTGHGKPWWLVGDGGFPGGTAIAGWFMENPSELDDFDGFFHGKSDSKVDDSWRYA